MYLVSNLPFRISAFGLHSAFGLRISVFFYPLP